MEDISLIGQYCPNIKSLKFNDIIIDEKVFEFFRIYGHKLEELYIDNQIEDRNKFFKLCPNLKINYNKIYEVKWDNFITYFDKYSQNIKTLHINLNVLTKEAMKTYIEHISRLKNLKKLELFCTLYTTEQIDD